MLATSFRLQEFEYFSFIPWKTFSSPLQVTSVEGKLLLVLVPLISLLHRKCQTISSHRKSLNWTNGHVDINGPNVHEWNMTGIVRLMRQLTSQDVSVKQGRALSLLPVREARERRLFLHEYQLQECRVELLATVIASSCGKIHSLLPPFPPPAGGIRGGLGLGSVDIIVFAFAMLSGSWESDATGGQFEEPYFQIGSWWQKLN